MYEHSRPLTEVLFGMFESFEEDPAALELLKQEALKLQNQHKNSGDLDNEDGKINI